MSTRDQIYKIDRLLTKAKQITATRTNIQLSEQNSMYSTILDEYNQLLSEYTTKLSEATAKIDEEFGDKFSDILTNLSVTNAFLDDHVYD